MDGPTNGTDATSPLSETQLRLLSDARVHHASVRTAMGLAMFNGVALLMMALVWLVGSALGFGSPWWALAMTASGIVELRGRELLRSFDARGPRLLAGNQLALLALILAYCAASATSALSAEGPVSDALGEYGELLEVMRTDQGANLGAGLERVDDLYRSAVLGFYAVVALLSCAFQGGCAYYYYSRQDAVRAVRLMPAWVRGLIGPT